MASSSITCRATSTSEVGDLRHHQQMNVSKQNSDDVCQLENQGCVLWQAEHILLLELWSAWLLVQEHLAYQTYSNYILMSKVLSARVYMTSGVVVAVPVVMQEGTQSHKTQVMLVSVIESCAHVLYYMHCACLDHSAGHLMQIVNLGIIKTLQGLQKHVDTQIPL